MKKHTCTRMLLLFGLGIILQTMAAHATDGELITAPAALSEGPVTWSYTTKKIAANKFEIHITATMAPGWHIYSQEQPADAIATPTKIEFVKNPLVKINGPVKEIGRKEKFKEPTLGVEQFQYADKLEFVQVVDLKVTSAKLTVSGSVTFQVCTNEKCLPPTTNNFSVTIDE